MGRKILYGGAFPEFAFHTNVAAALTHNAVARGESKSAPAAFVFGREKWLEQMLFYFITHPDAVVGDADANVVARLKFFGVDLLLLGCVDCERSRFQREAATVSHRIARIYHQVQDDLRKLAGIHFGVHTLFAASRNGTAPKCLRLGDAVMSVRDL